MQLGGDAQLLDALFVTRDAESGAVHAIDLATGGAGSTFAALLDFRLDPGRRRALTRSTLAEHSGGVFRPLIEALRGRARALWRAGDRRRADQRSHAGAGRLGASRGCADAGAGRVTSNSTCLR
jgi:hypothetical protein